MTNPLDTGIKDKKGKSIFVDNMISINKAQPYIVMMVLAAYPVSDKPLIELVGSVIDESRSK
jgi:hypothetical protein